MCLFFPSDLKAFLDSFHLRHAGAFWIDIVGQEVLIALANFYGVSVDYILGRKNDKN